MSTWLIIVVTLVYTWTSILQLSQGQNGFALMWFAYALANIGIMIAGGTK